MEFLKVKHCKLDECPITKTPPLNGDCPITAKQSSIGKADLSRQGFVLLEVSSIRCIESDIPNIKSLMGCLLWSFSKSHNTWYKISLFDNSTSPASHTAVSANNKT